MDAIFRKLDSWRKLYTNLVLGLILVALLTGCAGVQMAPSEVGQVYALQLGSTQWGVGRVAQGAVDTFVMSDGQGHYMLSWAINDAWAFLTCRFGAGECVTDDILQKANVVNATTMSEFVSCLEEHGWKMISASELPALIASAFSPIMPTFIFVPADGAWDIRQYQDWKGEEWY